jgi:hypothetical protein
MEVPIGPSSDPVDAAADLMPIVEEFLSELDGYARESIAALTREV